MTVHYMTMRLSSMQLDKTAECGNEWPSDHLAFVAMIRLGQNSDWMAGGKFQMCGYI